MKNGRTDTIILIVLVLVLIGLVVFFGIKFTNSKADNTEVVNSTVSEVKAQDTSTSQMSIEVTKGMQKDEAKKIAQDLYSKVYNIILEGNGLTGGKIVKLNLGNTEVDAYKIDFSKIENYFTASCMRTLQRYSDERTADGYYRTLNNIHSSTGLLDFIYTIFGVTDQMERNLEIKLFDDNTIVAKSIKSGKMFEKYIIFVKENDTWKIDMFE